MPQYVTVRTGVPVIRIRPSGKSAEIPLRHPLRRTVRFYGQILRQAPNPIDIGQLCFG